MSKDELAELEKQLMYENKRASVYLAWEVGCEGSFLQGIFNCLNDANAKANAHLKSNSYDGIILDDGKPMLIKKWTFGIDEWTTDDENLFVENK
jgi:hypothetical protein